MKIIVKTARCLDFVSPSSSVLKGRTQGSGTWLCSRLQVQR